MKRLFMLAALSALAVARPEKYKEQEDFQFSRSSSDDGTKSGFYGAQRGNMGGNYERAHNMDSLAQNQMSGLVRQVQGELGDGANTRAGSVYSAANSRGTYGSGHSDLTNLAGRNFHEGTYYDNSQSRSLSQSASAHNSAGYVNSHSQGYGGSGHGGYQRAAVSDGQTQTDDLQSLDNLQTSNQYDYGRQASHSSGYQANSGYREHSEYDHSNSNSQSGHGSNIRTRLISATPVRIVITPGGRVAIPVAAQTYDSTHGSSAFDQNAISSDAEALSQNNQASVNRPGNAKHYESSYSYQKKWEKHDTIPTSGFVVPISTESTIPKTSELYEDSEARRVNNQYDARWLESQSAHLGSASDRYNAVKSTSGQSRYQSNYNTQKRGDSSNSNLNAFTQSGYNSGTSHGASSDSLNAYTQAQYNTGSRYHGTTLDSNSNAYSQAAYNAGSHTDLNSQVEDLNTKPKSYQSSYSYHKSWERQGDPYVIKPASNGHYDSLSSQRLTSSSRNQGQYETYHSGSNYDHDQADCDENGHIRIARSYNTDNEDMEQQSQNYDDIQYSGQVVQNTWQNLDDLDKHSGNRWDQQDVGQESQNKWDNMEDSEQQYQGIWDQQNVEQKFQNQWADLNQQSTSDLNQHDDEQQSENTRGHIEDLRRDSMKNWGQIGHLASQSDNLDTWEKLGDITQQHQTRNDYLESLEQQVQNAFGEHTQLSETEVAYKPQYYGQHTQNVHGLEVSTTDSQAGNVNGDELHKIHKVDPNETEVTAQQHKSNNKQNPNNTLFDWQQLYNNGGLDKQESAGQNSNINYEAQHKANWEQIYRNIENDNKNRSVPYGYSNGFIPSFFHSHQNTHPAGKHVYEIQSWNSSRNSNSHTQFHRQHYATNVETYSHVNTYSNTPRAPLLMFWNKLNNIEKESGLSTHTQQTSDGQTYQAESNFTSIGLNQTNIFPVSEYHLTHPQLQKDWMTDKNKSGEVRRAINSPIIPEYQPTPQAGTGVQALSPKSYKELPNDTDVTKDIQSTSSEELERPQDMGRGDIGPEDISSKTDKNQYESQNTSDKITTHDTQLTINNNDTQTDELSNSQLAVLSLNQQENNQNIDSFINNNTSSLGANSFVHKQNQSTLEYNNTEAQTLNLTQTGTDIMYGIQNHHKNITNNFELHSATIAQQNVDDFSQITQQNNQNSYFQLPNFEQENVNVEQQSYQFGQENLHDFGQDNENQMTQNTNDFMQEDLQDFGDQKENLQQQYLHNFDQENKQGIVQKNETQIKENVYLQQHHLPHAVSAQVFGQQIQNFEQQDIPEIGEENVSDFGQQNKNLDQQHVHYFEQANIQDFGQQYEQPEQSNLQDYGQQHFENMEDLKQSDNNNKQDYPTNNWQLLPEIVEEPTIELKQYKDVQSNKSDSLEPYKVKPIEVVPVTEKPGFWKSVGGKFSDAKSKVVSWFKS